MSSHNVHAKGHNMSESQSNTAVVTAPKASRKDVKTSSIHARFASQKGIDTTRAAKLNRSFIRSNFDVIAKHWPALRASQKQNRDSNRYPDMMPAKVADAIVTRNVGKLGK